MQRDESDPTMNELPLSGRTLSRRRLFELGGATAALAALLAACGGGDDGAPGRLGNAPTPTDLETEPIGDVVYLRTLMSLEQSLLDVYDRFTSDGGLTGASAAALDRFIADHTAASDTLAGLIEDAGGEPFPCPNPWYAERYLGPTLDHVFGNADADDGPIAASDDIDRDVHSLMYALESFTSASTLQFVGHLTTAELRAATIGLGADAARRAATTALLINPAPRGYVDPSLLSAAAVAEFEAAATTSTTAAPDDSAGDAVPAVAAPYALSSRFGQLTAVPIEVGAPNELNLRYKTALDTPSDNAFAYTFVSCPA